MVPSYSEPGIIPGAELSAKFPDGAISQYGGKTMGFMDELRKLTQPYDDEDDFFEGADVSFKPQPKPQPQAQPLRLPPLPLRPRLRAGSSASRAR